MLPDEPQHGGVNGPGLLGENVLDDLDATHRQRQRDEQREPPSRQLHGPGGATAACQDADQRIGTGNEESQLGNVRSKFEEHSPSTPFATELSAPFAGAQPLPFDYFCWIRSKAVRHLAATRVVTDPSTVERKVPSPCDPSARMSSLFFVAYAAIASPGLLPVSWASVT